DPEMLAVHWRAAGDITRAARHALAAAERAEAALAFDRAARLYEAALEAHAPGALERRPLEAKLARALANPGRGKQAAAHYLAAADDQPESIELRRRAAEHLLRSGHIEDGVEVLRSVLGAEQLKLPRTTWGALGALVLHRAQLRLRGLRF